MDNNNAIYYVYPTYTQKIYKIGVCGDKCYQNKTVSYNVGIVERMNTDCPKWRKREVDEQNG